MLRIRFREKSGLTCKIFVQVALTRGMVGGIRAASQVKGTCLRGGQRRTAKVGRMKLTDGSVIFLRCSVVDVDTTGVPSS